MTQSNLNSQSKRASRVNLLLSTLIASAAMAGCADETIIDDLNGATLPTGGIVTTTGGVTPTGGIQGTGAVIPTGGVVPTGGTATGGVVPTGGTATGGVVPTGGTATGGVIPTGGTIGTGTCCPSGDCVCRGDEPTDATLDSKGPFAVEKYTSGFPVGDGFSAATIYYPANAEPPFSGIALCPGWTATQDSLGSVGPWGPFLASHGIATIVLDTLTTLDGVELRDDALFGALEAIKGENTRSGSPLEGKLTTTRFGVGGWSMGGGGTWIASATDSTLKTAMTLAGHHATVPGFVANYAGKITAPTIMFAGTADNPILGGGGQAQAMYTAIPASTPKILYDFTGLDHYAFADPAVNVPMGHYGLAFQKTFLEGDERYRKFLLTPGPNAADWQSNVQ